MEKEIVIDEIIKNIEKLNMERVEMIDKVIKIWLTDEENLDGREGGM